VRVKHFEEEDVVVAVDVTVAVAVASGDGSIYKEAFDGEGGEGLVVGCAGFDPGQRFTCKINMIQGKSNTKNLSIFFLSFSFEN